MKQNQCIDYLYVGGHKCGSTWLFEMLIQHPEISTPLYKEPNFFNRDFARGFDYYYSLWQKPGLRGEFSQDYFTDGQALHKIKKHCPEVKLIISLRNPYERMISHYLQWTRMNEEKNIEINEYIASHRILVERSLYYKYLNLIFSLFPIENIHLIFFEQLSQTPLQVLLDIFSFLQISQDYVPKNYQKKSGEAFIPDNLKLERMRQKLFRIIHQKRKAWIINFYRRLGLSRLYRILNGKKQRNKNYKINNAIVEELTADLLNLIKSFTDHGLGKNNRYIEKWLKEISVLSSTGTN